MLNSNPIIKKLDEYSRLENDEQQVMTVSGTLTSLALLSVLMIIPAVICWNYIAIGALDRAIIMFYGGLAIAFILGLIIPFKPQWSPYLAPIYAVCEGAAIGGLSALVEKQAAGIVIQAAGATFLTIFVMLTLYKANIIRATEKFQAVILTSLFAILGLYLVSFITSLFGFNAIANFLWGNSIASIVISAVICVIASLCLILDFDRIERFSQSNAPTFMNWYCAYGLLVTVVWMYVEFLRLFLKIRQK